MCKGFCIVLMSDRGGTNYTNWVGVQECNDLLKIYLAITHENTTVPYGERGLYHVLPHLQVHSESHFQKFSSDFTLWINYLSSMSQSNSFNLSQSTWVSWYWILVCPPPHKQKLHRLLLDSRNPVLFIFMFSAQCLTDITLKNTLELYAWKDQKEQGLGWAHAGIAYTKAHG